MSEAKAWIVWRVCDGKPGHENQTQGLINALSRQIDIKVIDISPLSCLQTVIKTLTGCHFHSEQSIESPEPVPDLIIGAGHRTHCTLLAVKKCFKAKAIVLMKPSLPLGWFDLCIVPEHDNVEPRSNCILTQGVINKIEYQTEKNLNQGLILLGGESKHFNWQNESILDQIKQIITNQDINWTVATSRRTPESLIAVLKSLDLNNMNLVLANEVDQYWLPEQLKQAAFVWVSQDSVSMVYEALSSGAACGLLDLPAKTDSRLVKGLAKLISTEQILTFDQWRGGKSYIKSDSPLAEADRCAKEVIKRYLL